jgi:pimeloyl-ACP methyl ester carboxylesterase
MPHRRRAAAARAYCTGLLLPGERKSIAPMAARIAPARVQAAHQSLHHVVARAEWDDAALLRAVRAQVLPAIEQHRPVRYWIVDDTGFAQDEADREAWRRMACPVLALWSGTGALGSWYAEAGGPLALWRGWADDVRSQPVDAGHFVPEELPDETADALGRFFAAAS